METVILEHTLTEPYALDDAQRDAWVGECCARHRARLRLSYVSPDGLRVICVLEAPDAEAVRLAARGSGLPFDRAYTVTVHTPEAPTEGA